MSGGTVDYLMKKEIETIKIWIIIINNNPIIVNVIARSFESAKE